MKKINKVIVGIVSSVALLSSAKGASASVSTTSQGYVGNTNQVVGARNYQDPSINAVRNTDQLNAKPTATPTVTLMPKPTATNTPTPKPTVTPTPKPSPKPTVKPSPKPSPKLSPKPSVKPSPKSTSMIADIVVNNIEKPFESLVNNIKKLFGF